MVVPMEQLEKFLTLQEEFKDLEDEDYYESWGSGVDDLTDEADPDEGDISAVEDLLEHAEHALNYKRKRQKSKKQPDQQTPEGPEVQSQLDTLHKSLLSPNLPYYVADKEMQTESDRRAAKDPRDLDKLSRSRPKDFNFSTLPAFVPDKVGEPSVCSFDIKLSSTSIPLRGGDGQDQ
ncbi:unnamed protein product, partial [Durusdinium trenchii]